MPKNKINNFPHSTKLRFTKNNFNKLRKIKYDNNSSFNKIINALISQIDEKSISSTIKSWKASL